MDFAEALGRPETDTSLWEVDVLEDFINRERWPDKHDFADGERQPGAGEFFRKARTRIHEAAQAAAAVVVVSHRGGAIDRLGADWVHSALEGRALLNGDIVRTLEGLHAAGWGGAVRKAALGPGASSLEISFKEVAVAKEVLRDYLSAISDPETLDDRSYDSSRADIRTLVRIALEALVLTRLTLSPLDVAIMTERFWSTSPVQLAALGERHGLSREAIRQRGLWLTSVLAHPAAQLRACRTAAATGITADLIDEAACDAQRFVEVTSFLPPPAPTKAYVELVFGRLLGRDVVLQEPAMRSFEVVPAAATVNSLNGTTRAFNHLLSHGLDTLEKVAELDLDEALTWQGVGPGTVTSLADMRQQARKLLGDEWRTDTSVTDSGGGRDVASLNPTLRTLNVLKRNRVLSVCDLIGLDRATLCTFAGVGETTLREIENLQRVAIADSHSWVTVSGGRGAHQ